MGDESVLSTIKDSFYDLIKKVIDFAPEVLVALVLLIVGLFVAKLLSNLLIKLLNYIEKHKMVNDAFNKLGISMVSVSGVLGLFLHWTILLIFISAAVDVLGLTVLSETFSSLISYIPNILSAALVAVLSLVAANAIKDVVSESAHKAKIGSYKTLAMTAKVIVLIFGLPLAVTQLGLDLSVINNNLTVIVAGIMLAFGLSFGLGGKEVASKLLNDAYKSFKK